MENQERKMRAGIYLRVSTLEQANEGYSLTVQENKLTEYAKYKDYEIANVYKDEGYSGASINRPAFRQMLTDIEANSLDIVLIYKLDRLTRSVKDLLNMLETFDAHNVVLYSLTENIDLSSPFGRAALKMSATFSELEREMIVERTKMGKDQKVKEGFYLPVRFNPFAYRYNIATKYFDLIPEEAEIVKDVYDKYLRGYSIRKLNDYCKATYNHPRFNNMMSCKALLHRPMYAGYFMYKGELIKGTNFEGFLPYEDYLKVQKKLHENSYRRTRSTSPYMLTGLVLCAKCGNRYVGKYKKSTHTLKSGEKKQYGTRYYGCAARIKRDKYYHPTACKNDMYRADKLENIIISAVKKLEFNDNLNEDVQYGIFDTLNSEIAENQAKINKLLDLYMSDLISKDAYEQRLIEYEKTIAQNKKIIEEEQKKIDSTPNTAIKYLKEKHAQFDDMTLDEKRQFLKLLIKYVSIDGDKVHIELRVK